MPAPEPKRRSILWVTNLAAPYRLPVWLQLAQQQDLRIAVLESNSGLRRDHAANRGQDWMHGATPGLDIVEFPAWKLKRGEARIYTLKGFLPLWKIRKFDVVLLCGWESPAYWALLATAAIFGIGRVGFYESPANTRTYKRGPVAWLRCQYFRSMHAVVVPGEAAAAAVSSMGVLSERIVTGFNAVDVEAFHRASIEGRPEATGAGLSAHRYLYVGQLIDRKRVGAILDAFQRVANSTDTLTVVGTGTLGHELREKAIRSGMNVKFVDQVENSIMPAIMANHHTLVLASEQEVWGLVVNEALAAGMHVVVSGNCGVARSVSGMSGVFICRNDLADLYSSMEKSKATWSGRIVHPEILMHTPKRFAADFERAFELADEMRRPPINLLRQ